MTAVLQHPLGPTTVQQWLATDRPADGSRHELILGYLHVTPAPSGRHQRAAFRLARFLEDAVEDAGREHELHVVPAVNVEISSAFRTALIPDVAVLNVEPDLVSFQPEHLVLAVEVWSPGNTAAERRTKLAGYAAAGVEYLWIVDLDDTGATVTTHRLRLGSYTPETVIKPGDPDTLVTSAPVPVRIVPARLT